jgi:hypothetical protein
MIETIVGLSGGGGVADATQLLHDFNLEYKEPAPPPDEHRAWLQSHVLPRPVELAHSRTPAHQNWEECAGDRPPDPQPSVPIQRLTSRLSAQRGRRGGHGVFPRDVLSRPPQGSNRE